MKKNFFFVLMSLDFFPLHGASWSAKMDQNVDDSEQLTFLNIKTSQKISTRAVRVFGVRFSQRLNLLLDLKN